MARTPNKQIEPTKLRNETREWLAKNTIPHAREIARELEDAGEDVHDLLAAIDELEALVDEGTAKSAKRPEKAET